MKVQIYGDSIMKAVVVDDNYKYKPLSKSLLDRLHAETGAETINRAHFGYTVEKGQALLQKDLEKGLDSQYALLEFGGNDCDFNWGQVAETPDGDHQPHTPLPKFLASMTAMARALLAAGVQPVLMTLPPLDPQRYLDFIGRLGNDTKNVLHWLGDVNRIYRYQEMYSEQIAKLAATLHLPLVDVRSRFLDRRDYGDLIARDGIHLTEAGYNLVYDAFREALAEAC